MASSDDRGSAGDAPPARSEAESAELLQGLRADLMAPGIGEGVGPQGVGHVYMDSADPPNPTIGWGANLNESYNQQFLQDHGYDVRAVLDGKETISEEHARELLDLDIGHALDDARAVFPNYNTMDEHAQLAVGEMAFNLGKPHLEEFQHLQQDLAQGDYAAAEHEVHYQGIGDDRYEHYVDLMTQAAADQREAPALHEQPAHDFLFDAGHEAAPAASNPFVAGDGGVAEAPGYGPSLLFEPAPALTEDLQLPAGLLNTDFGTGGATPAPHDDRSALPDAFHEPPAAAVPDPAAEPASGHFFSGIMDLFGPPAGPPDHVDLNNPPSDWGTSPQASATQEPPSPGFFDQVTSWFSTPPPAHEESPVYQESGWGASHESSPAEGSGAFEQVTSWFSTPPPAHEETQVFQDGGYAHVESVHDTGPSIDSFFGGGGGSWAESSSSDNGGFSHDSDYSSHDSGYSSHDSGYSSDDTGSSSHDSGASSFDSGGHDSGSMDSGGVSGGD